MCCVAAAVFCGKLCITDGSTCSKCFEGCVVCLCFVLLLQASSRACPQLCGLGHLAVYSSVCGLTCCWCGDSLVWGSFGLNLYRRWNSVAWASSPCLLAPLVHSRVQGACIEQGLHAHSVLYYYYGLYWVYIERVHPASASIIQSCDSPKLGTCACVRTAKNLNCVYVSGNGCGSGFSWLDGWKDLNGRR